MTISYQWLLDYLPQPVPIDELSRILTSIGLEVEAVEKAEQIKGGLEGLVIGEVLTCVPHPNADKLRLTTVTIGGPEILNIVCGAPNVAAGQKVVVAPVGATVHPLSGEPFQIKKAKIRGEASEGMLCAEDEIGLGESHAGIMVLPADAVVGTLAKDYFKIGAADYAIHIGLTPNRSDAASHIGVARDVCAYLSHHSDQKVEVRLPDLHAVMASGTAPVAVDIQAPDGCPRYMGVTLQGVKVGPSPDWLKTRLATIGLRSINNIVDVTNYVLHEYGQPLHAFDADRIAGKRITVRYADANEKFVTLDGKERSLRASEDLMICDDSGPVAMAGVFGGLHSGVSDTTTNIFIESAYFDPATIRRASMHHGLRTDAATHFEKGVDADNLSPAMVRAAILIMQVAGGQPQGEVVDVYPRIIDVHTFPVRYDFINRLAGKQYDPASVMKLLRGLGFTITEEDASGFVVKVPSAKHDVRQPADVVEEIMRIDGLDNIPIPQRLNISLLPEIPGDRKLRDRIAQNLSDLGFSEIVTNSITNSRYYEGIPVVKMLNSLSSELDAMRPSMLESGLEVVSYNLARRNMDLLLFEHGFVYDADYKQYPKLALYASGMARSAGVKSAALKADAFFLKSVIQQLLQLSGIRNAVLSYDEGVTGWKWKNRQLCTLSEVPAARCQAFEIKERVWYAEIDWALWVEAMRSVTINYSEVPRFPAVQRDLALVLDQGVTYAQVQRVTDKLKLQPLQSYGLFDVFESEKLGAGKKSLALSYTFQLSDRTLTDAETEALMQQLTAAYTKELGAQIRN